MDPEEYAARHPQFVTHELPPLLAGTAKAGGVVGDIGCGDGAILWALRERGLLGDVTYAVDISAGRVENAMRNVPGVVGLIADAAGVPLESGSLDGVISSQVIEHVDDDHAFLAEMVRLLRPGGWWYIGTVLRGPRAWWIYKVNGVRLLDPTHVREYKSTAEFKDLLERAGLEVTHIETTPTRFPLSDLAIRAVARGRAGSDPYRRIPEFTRRVRIRVPGYSLLEASGVRGVRRVG